MPYGNNVQLVFITVVPNQFGFLSDRTGINKCKFHIGCIVADGSWVDNLFTHWTDLITKSAGYLVIGRLDCSCCILVRLFGMCCCCVLTRWAERSWSLLLLWQELPKALAIDTDHEWSLCEMALRDNCPIVSGCYKCPWQYEWTISWIAHTGVVVVGLCIKSRRSQVVNEGEAIIH